MHAATAEEPTEGIRRVASTTLLTNLAIAGTGLVIVTVIGRVLGPTGRGEVAAFQLVPLIGALVFGLGLPHAASYFAAVAPAGARQVVASSAVVAIVVGVPGVVVTAVVTWAYLGGSSTATRTAGVVFSAAVVLLAVGLILIQPQRSVQRTQIWNVLRYLLDSSLAGAAIFVLVGQRSLTGMAVVQLTWIAVVVVAATVPWWRRRQRSPERVSTRRLVAFGAPTMLATLPYFLNFRVDQLVLNAVRGSEELGLYAAAVSVSAASLPVINTISMLALPRLAGRVDGRDQSAGRFIRSSIGIGVVTAVGLAAVAPVAVVVLFGGEFAESVPLAVPLSFVTALLGVTTTAEEVLRAYGDVRFPARAQLLGLLVNVAVLALLIPRWGAWGAVVASGITYAGVCAAVLGRVRVVAHLSPSEMIPSVADLRALWALRRRGAEL